MKTYSAIGALMIGAMAALPASANDLNFDEVVTTSSPLGDEIGRSLGAVGLLTGKELARKEAISIGETLRVEPGISTSSFGPGASRPIIRGQGGDRIRVLKDGVGSFDAAQTSVDHAVPVSPAMAERIEIVRGPASLLYGSSASGGVVNVITPALAEEALEKPFTGSVRYGYGTAADSQDLAAGFSVQTGNVIFHASGVVQDGDDYRFPGLAISDQLLAEEILEDPEIAEEAAQGRMPNSAYRTENGTGGLTWLFDGGEYEGFVALSGSFLHTLYGIPAGLPGGHHHGEEEEDEDHGDEDHDEEEGEEEEEGEIVRIDLDQARYDLKAELRGPMGWFEKLRLRLGYGDYKHTEFEGAEEGTVFDNEEFEARGSLTSRSYNFLGGEARTVIGMQARHRDFVAAGAEAFVPPSEQLQLGVFTFTDVHFDGWKAEMALRYEHINNDTPEWIDDEDATPMPVERSFDAFSFALGAGVDLTDNIFAGINLFRSERAPSLEEQFAFGPHLATSTFEIGDINLGKEKALGAELSIRGSWGPLTAVLNGFYTDYDDYIFERETGEELDELPVFVFTATDAEFYGFEFEVDVDIATFDSITLSGDAQVSYVRAKASGLADQDLPRIPPLSGLVGLDLDADRWSFRAEAEWADDQTDVAAFELPTDGYVSLNLFASVQPFAQHPGITVEVQARNLTNEEIRRHSSFIKDGTPQPGRDFRFVLRGQF